MSVLSASRHLPPAGISPLVAAAIAEGDRIRTRAIDRLGHAADASHFQLTPRAVVIADDAAEVAAILRAAGHAGEHVTFRSGGTSLSGQGCGDGVLVDVRQRFREIELLEGGRRVRVQPGATVRQVNSRLARFGRRLGPDPASEAACTIGGVVANNSSGMACGTAQNTYATLESMVFVLASGTMIDTAAPDADAQLREREPELVDGLVTLQRRVRDNPASVAAIRRQFSLKNTMGYGINAFLDFDSPCELLAHLIVGSEGTLAFVAEVTLRTVAVKPLASTAVAVFPDLAGATRALPELVATGAATLELMDATSLRVGQALPDPPRAIQGFEVDDQAALLIEYHADHDSELHDAVSLGNRVLGDQALREPVALSTDAEERRRAWAFRKGLYASVAGNRASGTTALLEDVAVPVAALELTCAGLGEMFARHGYPEGVIFGHAKDGNIHFMLTDRFESEASISRFSAFTEEMVDLILSAEGTLKAEHGTGRMMAPFVRRQYGDELFEVMQALKTLVDPHRTLGRGVLIDEDPSAHLAAIKLLPTVEPEVDRCTECGYCEPVCPSADLTLTPRRRIVVRRAMAAAERSGDDQLLGELSRDFEYAGKQTCAVDGMCATACPVQINTGALVKHLRAEAAPAPAAAGWKLAAHAWGPASRATAAALSTAHALPAVVPRSATTLARRALGAEAAPHYSRDLPAGGPARAPLRGTVGADGGPVTAIYLPACIGSVFGPGEGALGVSAAFLELLTRAGLTAVVPAGIESLCCGTPWSSKGMTGGHAVMADRVLRAIRALPVPAGTPVVTDASSCTSGFQELLEQSGFAVEDAVAFATRELLPRLRVTHPMRSVALHPTCSSVELGITAELTALAQALADDVVVPDAWRCCAFAGDRGLLHPELTASATGPEAAEVRALGTTRHASCNRTCELGMTRATGRPYHHILELLEEATR